MVSALPKAAATGSMQGGQAHAAALPEAAARPPQEEWWQWPDSNMEGSPVTGLHSLDYPQAKKIAHNSFLTQICFQFSCGFAGIIQVLQLKTPKTPCDLID